MGLRAQSSLELQSTFRATVPIQYATPHRPKPSPGSQRTTAEYRREASPVDERSNRSSAESASSCVRHHRDTGWHCLGSATSTIPTRPEATFTNPHHRSPTSRRSRSAPYVTLVDGRCFYSPGVDAAAEVGSITPVSASAACRCDARRATAASVKTDSPRSGLYP